MKALLGTIAWILCTMLVILPISAKPKPPPPKPVNYPIKTWKLETNKPASYTTLIASLRTELDSKKICGIPSTSKSPPTTKAFILVEITSLRNKKVTLAFRATNVYYVGYKDEIVVDGKLQSRANFVKEDFKELERSSLFSDATIRKELPHGGGYDNLEKVAKTTRGKLNLGVSTLSRSLDVISGADYTGNNKPKNIGQNLAKFALVAIQMIAEGSRFKYIEERVRDLGTKEEATLVPDTTFLKLENNWGTVSERIHLFSTTNRNCDQTNVEIQCPIFQNLKISSHKWVSSSFYKLSYQGGSIKEAMYR